MCTQCQIPLVLSAGVLGHQVAKFRVASADLKAGSRIAFLSDGISTRFRLEELQKLDPVEACQLVMSRYRRKEDDATVLVADLRA
jgi:negative regulator of sigma-B (phosphoserine phosphatase)